VRGYVRADWVRPKTMGRNALINFNEFTSKPLGKCLGKTQPSPIQCYFTNVNSMDFIPIQINEIPSFSRRPSLRRNPEAGWRIHKDRVRPDRFQGKVSALMVSKIGVSNKLTVHLLFASVPLETRREQDPMVLLTFVRRQMREAAIVVQTIALIVLCITPDNGSLKKNSLLRLAAPQISKAAGTGNRKT
jgi:hypothetical protein